MRPLIQFYARRSRRLSGGGAAVHDGPPSSTTTNTPLRMKPHHASSALRLAFAACLSFFILHSSFSIGRAAAIDIGSRLEMFMDDFIIGKTEGAVSQHLHKPVPREVVLVTNMPWEGSTCCYYTVFQADGLYHMYYRGATEVEVTKEFTCYAYSKDGIKWTRPSLGLIEYKGSKDNNIIHAGVAGHNFTPFHDTNPACPQNERYKAMGGHTRTGGLYAFKAPNPIHWSMTREKPVFPSNWEKLRSGGPQPWFDSQNIAFYDPLRKNYVLYFRHWRDGKYRDIMMRESPDLVTWTDTPRMLEYPGLTVPDPNAKETMISTIEEGGGVVGVYEHLYTNTILQYPRSPSFYIGFPARFLPRTSQVEPLFMSSRDGVNFKRWPDAVIPLDAPEDRDGNRSNYIWLGLLDLPGDEKNYSVYAHEAYYQEGRPSRLRRFTWRKDGFVSMRATPEGGVVETKLLTFTGGKLVLNYKTKAPHFKYAGGSVQVEILDEKGKPIPGFAKVSGKKMQGDSIEEEVTWDKAAVGALAGKPIRLRFHMVYADLYSFQFK